MQSPARGCGTRDRRWGGTKPGLLFPGASQPHPLPPPAPSHPQPLWSPLPPTPSLCPKEFSICSGFGNHLSWIPRSAHHPHGSSSPPPPPPKPASIHLPLFRPPSPQPPIPPTHTHIYPPSNPSVGQNHPQTPLCGSSSHRRRGGGGGGHNRAAPASAAYLRRGAIGRDVPPPRAAPGGICRQRGGRKLICFEEEIKKINGETSNVDPHPLPQREKLNELPTWARVANNSPGWQANHPGRPRRGVRGHPSSWRGPLPPACPEVGCDAPTGREGSQGPEVSSVVGVGSPNSLRCGVGFA